jgi:hypothetical protein
MTLLVCPYMLTGRDRQDVLDTGLGEQAFNATKFQCLGSMCMAYRIAPPKSMDQKPIEYCGLVGAENLHVTNSKH